MGSDLTLYSGDALGRAKTWTSLSAEEQRRRCKQALAARDHDALYQLTEAWLILHSGAGSKLSPHSRRAYAAGIKRLCRDWQGVNMLRPARSDGALWVRSLEQAGLSTSTIQVRLAAARALYKAVCWVLDTPDTPYTADPFADVHPAKDPTPAWEKREPYDQSSLERMLACAKPVDQALILLGAHSGLRISEVLALKWEDVDLDRRRLIVQRGKGGKRRTVSLSRSLIGVLSTLPRTSDYVIPYRSQGNARLRLAIICKDAGTRYLACHSLRHAAGTRLVREGRTLEDAARHLGHRSIETTRAYAKWSDDSLRSKLDEW